MILINHCPIRDNLELINKTYYYFREMLFTHHIREFQGVSEVGRVLWRFWGSRRYRKSWGSQEFWCHMTQSYFFTMPFGIPHQGIHQPITLHQESTELGIQILLFFHFSPSLSFNGIMIFQIEISLEVIWIAEANISGGIDLPHCL